MEQKLKNKRVNTINIEMLFIYCLVFLLVFRVAGNFGDIVSHTHWAEKIDFSNFNQSIQVSSHPIWHICVALLIQFLLVPDIYAAPLINSVFTVLYMIVLRYTLNIFLEANISERLKNYITVILTFVSAINIPFNFNFCET